MEQLEFLDTSSGWTYTGQEITGMYERAKENNEISQDTSLKNWLKSQPFTVKEKVAKPKFENISREQFDNNSEENLVPVLKQIYGDSIDIEEIAGGIDAIKVKDKNSNLWNEIVLNTQYNRDGGGMLGGWTWGPSTLNLENAPNAYDNFLNFLKQIDPGAIEADKNLSPDYKKYLTDRYEASQKAKKIEDLNINYNTGIYTLNEIRTAGTERTKPLKNMDYEERVNTMDNIATMASNLWTDILANPESYGLTQDAVANASINTLDEASLSSGQMQDLNTVVWENLNKELAGMNMWIDEESFQDNFSAWTPVFQMGEAGVKSKIAKQNFNASAQAGTLPDELGLLQSMDTNIETLFTTQNPDLKPRITIIKDLNLIQSEIEKIQLQINELDPVKDEKKLNALTNQYNKFKTQYFATKQKLDKLEDQDPLQYDYTGQRPEDSNVSEQKWQRLAAATTEIEIENGVNNLSELTNITAYYNNLKKQRLMIQQDAANEIVSIDLNKLNLNLNAEGEALTAFDYDQNYWLYNKLKQNGYDVSGDSVEINLNEYLSLLRTSKVFNEFQSGWQADYLDENAYWFGRSPESETGGYGLVFPGLNTEDIKKAALNTEWMMANQDKLEVLYEKINIQPDLKRQEDEIGFWGTAIETAASMGFMGGLKYTRREFSRDPSGTGNLPSTLEGRYKLDTYQDLINEINEVRADEGVAPVTITPEEVDALAVDAWGAEGWGQTTGGFVPVIADLAASVALVETGLGTAAGLANISKYTRYARMYLKGLSHKSTGINKAMYYLTTGAKMEAETQLAGFDLGSGATFSVFGNATRNLKLFSKFLPESAKIIDMSIKASLGGATAAELAGGVVEPMFRDINDQDSFNQWWGHHYGSFDETTQRIIKNAVLFNLYGMKDVYRKTAAGDAATLSLWRDSRGNISAMNKINKKITELETQLKEEQALGRDTKGLEQQIKTLQETSSTIMMMEANKRDLGSMSALKWNQSKGKEGAWEVNPEFKTKTQNLLNELAKQGNSKAPTVEIVNTLPPDAKGAYHFTGNTLQINPLAKNAKGQLIFNEGVVPHEMIVHWGIRSRLAQNPQLLAAWTPKLKEGIDKILETTDLNFDIMANEVFRSYSQPNPKTGKLEMKEGLKAEEVLAMYVELMANPQIYYSTVGKGFWKNTKNQILNLLEGSGLKRYTEKSIAELDNVQALEILARLAQEMTFNKTGGQKIRVAQNLDQLRDPLLTTRALEGGGRPRQGEYKILELENLYAKDKQVSQKLKEIAERNKIQEERLIQEGVWKLGELENKVLADEIKNALIENNQGLVELLAQKAYNNPNIAGLEQGLRIPLKDWRQGFNQQLIEMINSYEPINTKTGKRIPFGAYITKNLPLRFGNILAAEKGKTPEAGGRITQDIVAETRATELAGDLMIARELKIKNEVLTEFENKLKEEIDLATDLDLLSYEKFRTTWPKGVVNEIFGRTRAEREKYIRENAETLMAIWPELNQTQSGKSLGVGTNVLNFAYGKGPRSKMSEGAGGAGLDLRTKEPRTPQQLIDFLGFNLQPGQKGYTNSQAKIKGVINLAMRGLANQLLRDPSKTKLQESLLDFSVQDAKVKEQISNLEQLYTKEFERIENARERGEILELRESDINQAIKRIDNAMAAFLREGQARLREGLAPELYSKDSKILEKAFGSKNYNKILDQIRPTTLKEMKALISEWNDLSKSTKDVLKEVTQMFKADMTARDNLYARKQAIELNMQLEDYKTEYKDQVKSYKELSAELGTKDKSIKELRTDAAALNFAKSLLKELPNWSKLNPEMQKKIADLMGFGDTRGSFIVDGKQMTFGDWGLSRGQYSELMKEMFGKDWESSKDVPYYWEVAFAPKAWGKVLNTEVGQGIMKNTKLTNSQKFQELQELFKQEGQEFDVTVDANLKVLKDVYVAMGTVALEMKRQGKSNTEILQSLQDFMKPQTNRGTGILKTLVPVLFLDLAPQKGIGSYKEKIENYYTEHMRELFNANKQFLRNTKSLLEGKIDLDLYNKRLDREVQDLMQGLIGARISEIKDAPGKTYKWYYDPILNITMGGKKSWDNIISLEGNNIYNPTTLSDMIYITGTRYARDIIAGTPGRDLTSIGVQVKKRVEFPKDYLSARTRNQKLTQAGNMLYSKDMSNAEYLGQLKNRDKALEFAREQNKKKKGISVFDFDDTVAKTKSKVRYKLPDGTTGKLDATQFAKRHEALERAGATFDFREFEQVIGGTKGPLFDLAVKRQGKFGTGDIYILTARPQSAAPAIHAFLKGMGLNIPMENIIGLENGAPKAKSDWMLKKAAEGYNDFYFADDAIKNVKAVKDVLDVVDVKSKVQQALMSKDYGAEFNKVIEETFGVERFKDYSRTKARAVGAKHKESWWLPASASDLPLIMDRIAGKGKQGEAHQRLFKETLYDPYARAEMNITESKLSIYRDFKALKKQYKEVVGQLKEKVGDYSVEQAIRVRNWNTLGIEIPGLSKRDQKMLVDHVNKSGELSAFADQIIGMQKGVYQKPGRYWETGGLWIDINNTIKGDLRSQYLKEFTDNVNTIFTPEFYNKLEAVQGPKYVESLKNILGRMERGSNRSGRESRLETKMLNFLNNATAGIMFLNTRSAVLQTISSFNYINWTDNNPFKAAARFANLPQYIKDWNRLMNSDWAVARRKGTRINIQEAELVEALEGQQNKGEAMLGWLLEKGFILTKMGDTFATATGGATFYRNRINTYKKQGLSEKVAERKAYEDWVELSELNQQSARMDKISLQQATPLGRVVLAFANTPMQYARLQKRAYLDLKNNRGDAKTNLSKIVYYAFVQNLIFNALQNAVFTELYDDPGISDDKTIRIANGMADGILRGGGIVGAGVSTIKNVALKLYLEDQKRFDDDGRTRPKYSNAAWEVLGISPPLKAKVGKIRNGFSALEYNMDEILEGGFSLDNPAYLAVGNLTAGFTNVPLDRLIIKLQNIEASMNEELQWYERLALLGGWAEWNLGIEDGKTAKYFGTEERWWWNKEDATKEVEKQIENQIDTDLLFKINNP
jgi:hypothetical protein